MLKPFRKKVFSLYERPVLRNWFYTLAFAIFVPVGFRFAVLAWSFGTPLDRLFAIIGGFAVGVVTLVTLLRIWAVPPRQTVNRVHDSHHEIKPELSHNGGELLIAIRRNSARNREIARSARALGSTLH